MYSEEYRNIYSGEDIHIRPGNTYTFKFDAEGMENADRLFFTGETAMTSMLRNEPGYPLLYRLIDDSLNTEEANKHQYCLDMTADNSDYPKIAYYKVMFPPVFLYFCPGGFTDHWVLGISVKAKNLKIHPEGFLRVTAEVRYKKEGQDPRCTVYDPDESIVLDFPEGSFGWQDLRREFDIDYDRVASVGYLVEGIHYSGEVYVENPLLASDSKDNIIADFSPHYNVSDTIEWMGQNLSRKEWPEFDITVNGKLIHSGELFERCHRYPENEIVLPQGALVSGENTVTFKLTSHYRDALAYNIREFGVVIHEPGFVISVPEIIRAEKEFAVILKTGKDNETVSYVWNGQSGSVTYGEAGLHGLKLMAPEPAQNLKLELTCGEKTEYPEIPRCIYHTEDGVMTGSSDTLYIRQDDVSYNDFLCWYFNQHLGNMITIRQAYRWSGTRALNDALFRRVSRFLNEAGVKYAHIHDGRELPGININPTEESLAGEGFLGRQTHERDGCYVYWGMRDISDDISSQKYHDLHLRMRRKYPETVGSLDVHPADQIFSNGGYYYFRDPAVPGDMEAAANAVVNQMSLTRETSVRHTGPSALFRYVYQAGYPFAGVELMYGPTELLIAALRGAAEVYGGKEIGAHLAVQWSTSPHDTPERFRRYFLCLYICYMQGIDQINTEEGLWHLEEKQYYHHRFSAACRGHLKQQQDIYRYILSHSRTGRYYTPIAFIQGRYDGWTAFGRGSVWGKADFTFSDAEKCWDILTYFYPRSVLDMLYFTNCENEPKGYYTGTPRGNVNIVPIEGKDFSDYRLLIAPGYNKALPEDMDKFRKYAEQGGKLVIGWPQLAVTTDRKDVKACNHWYIRHPFTKAIAHEASPVFKKDTFDGKPVSVSCHICPYEAVLYTDSHRPIVYKIPMGRGFVYFVNTKEYAGSDAVYAVYRQLLDLLVPECLEKEDIYAQGDRDVQFTVFDQGNGQKHIYFLTTDWYNDPEQTHHKGTLLLNGFSYTVDVPFGKMVKTVCCGGTAVWPVDDGNEVISNDGKKAEVQGYGKADFMVASNGTVRKVTADFTKQAAAELTVQ